VQRDTIEFNEEWCSCPLDISG